ncbi:hypothetical protein DFH06DRAFT_968468 [Mycena polygramma]|nr:hypothetical protein DFH06DRAFT_968468 [Mycena polygramma]
MAEKRKRPPSFQHFPINRAIKLKQTWVQNVKIKSKWKAEKRKADVVPPRAEGEEDVGIDDMGLDKEPEPGVRVAMPRRPPPATKRIHQHKPQPAAESSDAPSRPPPAAKRIHEHRTLPGPPEAESSDAPSLRDRAREAYSQASLHTYRSDPFGKRQRGGKAGTKGRGQPNMKMRMDVLLETIKRDFT